MKRSLLAGTSLALITVAVRRTMQPARNHRCTQRNWLQPVRRGVPKVLSREGEDATAKIARAFLMYFVVPLWTAAGVADAMCHRRAHIEKTTGPAESVLHIIMLTEVGIPLLAALFLEITSPVLALLIASFILHEITSLWDVSYAVKRREVTPIEQHVHSFLEIIPLMAASVVTILHWPQFLSLIGIRREPRDFEIRLKNQPIPLLYSLGVIGSVTVLEWMPYTFELVRGIRASSIYNTKRREPHNAPINQ